MGELGKINEKKMADTFKEQMEEIKGLVETSRESAKDIVESSLSVSDIGLEIYNFLRSKKDDWIELDELKQLIREKTTRSS